MDEQIPKPWPVGNMEEKRLEHEDRRASPRIPLRVIVTCTDTQGRENVLPRVFYAMSHNFSAGGLLIESFEKIQVSSMLEIKFAIPSLGRSIRVLGKVLRSTAAGESSDQYLSGIIFMRMDAEDQRALFEFISKAGD